MSAFTPHRLLEHLSIRPFVGLAFDLNWLVPAPLVIDKLFVLRLTGVKLRELVALVIGCDIEGRLFLLAPDDEGTLNDGVVLDAVYGRAAKDVFSGGLETGEETT